MPHQYRKGDVEESSLEAKFLDAQHENSETRHLEQAPRTTTMTDPSRSNHHYNNVDVDAVDGDDNTPQRMVSVSTASDTLQASHECGHLGDLGDGASVPINKATYIFVLCAALNSCNLGYDIGVSTEAGKIIQEEWDLTNVQRQIFVGSINFWASKYYFTELVHYCLGRCTCLLGSGILMQIVFSFRCITCPLLYRWIRSTLYLCSCCCWIYSRSSHYGHVAFL